MRKIDFIGIHCSGSDIDSHDNIETIAQWHKERGFSEIGYNFVIVKSGEIFIGRDIEKIPAHIYGHNKNSIGICLTGDKVFSEAQFTSLKKLLIDLMKQYGLTLIDILPHKAFNKNKTCPNFDLGELLKNIYS